MQSATTHVNAYLAGLPDDRKKGFQKLRKTILANIPEGYQEEMNYGMIGYVVPLRLYPLGYHVKPKTPLPFVNIASQKHHIALYHLGLYSSPELSNWFRIAYPQHCKSKLDMGKSCIRFKKPEQIPFEMIGKLMQKMSVKDWIQLYENTKKP